MLFSENKRTWRCLPILLHKLASMLGLTVLYIIIALNKWEPRIYELLLCFYYFLLKPDHSHFFLQIALFRTSPISFNLFFICSQVTYLLWLTVLSHFLDHNSPSHVCLFSILINIFHTTSPSLLLCIFYFSVKIFSPTLHISREACACCFLVLIEYAVFQLCMPATLTSVTT